MSKKHVPIIILCIVFFIAMLIGNKVNENRKKHESSYRETSYVFDYIGCCKESMPSGINTSVTYEQAFNRFFSNGKWTLISKTATGEAQVDYTGIFSDPDGAYRKADIYFTVSVIDDETAYINIQFASIDDLALTRSETTEFIYSIYGLY